MATEQGTKQTDKPTDYSALWEMVGRELRARAAAGEPLRVNLWDANHAHPAPREMVAQAGLREAVRTVGTPVYAIEAVGSVPSFNRMFADYRGADAVKRGKIERKLADSPLAGSVKALLGNLFAASAEGLDVYFPDPRPGPKFSDLEWQLYQRFVKELQQAEGGCFNTISDALLASLSPQEQEAFLSAKRKFSNATSYAEDEAGQPIEVNEGIAQRINKRFPDQAAPGKSIPITLYGAGHFGGEADLNERLPGLDIAIFEDATSAQEFYALSGARQFPHYVWYSEQRRLVKVEGDAVKMELLGAPSVAALRQWERGEVVQETAPAAAFEFSPEVKARCEQAVQHLKPYQPASQTVPDGGFVPPAGRHTDPDSARRPAGQRL